MTYRTNPANPFWVDLEGQHRFDSARDAIDAISAFEANVLDEWEYGIEFDGKGWRAKVNRIDGKPLRGHLSPVVFREHV